MDVGKGRVITGANGNYTVIDFFRQGDLCDLYLVTSAGGQEMILKIAGDPVNNDLVEREARSLAGLLKGKGSENVGPFVPVLVDSFMAGNSRANVLTYADGLSPREFYSLKEVREVYPKGVEPEEPRTAAWIWRKLLVALSFAHQNNIVHGAVLPEHVLIHPEGHALILIDWTASVETGGQIPVAVEGYEAWYPKMVLEKEGAVPGVDVYMGAECLIYLLGGDPIIRIVPEAVPSEFLAHFRGCTMEGQVPPSASVVWQEFTDLIERMWGERRFVEFRMPARQ